MMKVGFPGCIKVQYYTIMTMYTMYTTLCYAMVYYAIFLSSNQSIYLSIDFALYTSIRAMYNEDCYLIRSL